MNDQNGKQNSKTELSCVFLRVRVEKKEREEEEKRFNKLQLGKPLLLLR